MPPALPKSEDLAAFAELQTKVVRARRQLKMVRDERGRGALSLVRFFAPLLSTFPPPLASLLTGRPGRRRLRPGRPPGVPDGGRAGDAAGRDARVHGVRAGVSFLFVFLFASAARGLGSPPHPPPLSSPLPHAPISPPSPPSPLNLQVPGRAQADRPGRLEGRGGRGRGRRGRAGESPGGGRGRCHGGGGRAAGATGGGARPGGRGGGAVK